MGFLIDKIEWTENENGQKQRIYHFSDEAVEFFKRLRAKHTVELLDEKGYEPEEIEEIIEKMREEGKSEREVEEELDRLAREN